MTAATKEAGLINTFGSLMENLVQDSIQLVINLLDRAFAPYVGTLAAASQTPPPRVKPAPNNARAKKKPLNYGGSQRVLDYLKKGPAPLRELMPVYGGTRSRVSAAVTRLKHLGLVVQGPQPRMWQLKK